MLLKSSRSATLLKNAQLLGFPRRADDKPLEGQHQSRRRNETIQIVFCSLQGRVDCD